MRRLFLPAILLMLSGTVYAAPAISTACALNIEAAPGTWLIRSHDPFDGPVPVGTYALTFRNVGGETCLFTPVFKLNGQPLGLDTGTGARLQYVLMETTRGVDATPRPGDLPLTPPPPQIELEKGGQVSLNYQLVVTDPGIVRDGTYLQDLNIEAIENDFDVVGGTAITLGLEVLPSARIGLAGTYTLGRGYALVDLGPLKEGIAPVLLNLRVRSTRGYRLNLSSLNNGNLRLGETEWYVPYSLQLGDRDVNLSGQDSIGGPSVEPVHQQNLPFTFTIGGVEGVRAGRYSDVISIAVEPL